jgi:hypothetical protein
VTRQTDLRRLLEQSQTRVQAEPAPPAAPANPVQPAGRKPLPDGMVRVEARLPADAVQTMNMAVLRLRQQRQPGSARVTINTLLRVAVDGLVRHVDRLDAPTEPGLVTQYQQALAASADTPTNVVVAALEHAAATGGDPMRVILDAVRVATSRGVFQNG